MLNLQQMVLTPHGEVPIETLKAGDLVISEHGIEQVKAVDTFYEPENKHWVLVNEQYAFSPQQSVYASGRLIHAKDLQPHMYLTKKNGRKVEIKTVRKVYDKSPKVKLLIDRKKSLFNFFKKNKATHTYYLNGFLVHNASRFWVGNGGDWAGTTHWSASTGGASGASEPTSSDDANFDGNSFSSASQTVTNNSSANCAAWNWTGVTNTPTFSLNNYLFTHGNITLVSGMATTQVGGWFLQVIGSGAYNINFAGVVMNFNITFNDVGTFTLTGALTDTSSSCRVLLQKGTLNLNGQTVNVYQFSCDGSTQTRTLNMGSSSVTATNFDFSSTTGLTFNAGTSVLTVSGSFTPNGLTYNEVDLNFSGNNYTLSNGTYTTLKLLSSMVGFICSSATITTLTANATLSSLQCGTITTVNINSNVTFSLSSGTITNLNIRASSTLQNNSGTITNLTLYEDAHVTMHGLSVTNLTITKDAGNYMGPTTIDFDITVTGTFTATGISQTDRVFLMGKAYNNAYRGELVKITAATVSIANADFQNIKGAGAGTWSGTSIGDMGNNSGIAFTTPVTRYWVGDSGDWEDTTHWASSTGGTSGATMPLPQDTVKIDANSISATGKTITINTYNIPAFDTTGVLHSPTIAHNNINTHIFVRGTSWILSGITPSGTGDVFILCPDTGNDMTITSNGITIPWIIAANGIGTGKVSLGDDWTFNSTFGEVDIVSGYFSMNNHNLTVPMFMANYSCASNIDLGTGTLTINQASGTGTVNFNDTSNMHVISAASASIVFSNSGMTVASFYGRKEIFHNITFNCGGAINLYNGFQVDSLTFTGNAQTILFENGKHFLIKAMSLGSASGKVYTIKSMNAGNPAFLINPTGIFSFDYVTVQDITGYSGAISSTGFKSPTASAFDDEGTTQNWVNTGNIFASDNVYATNTLTAADNGQWMDEVLGSGFGFAVPTDAQLLGMEVKIEIKSDTLQPAIHLWPYIEPNATVGGSFWEPSPMGPYVPTTSDVAYTWGSSIHIWDSALTPTDVNSSNFGAGMDGIMDEYYGSDINISVDQMQVNVYYIPHNPAIQYWYMGSHSTNTSGNTGLIFATPTTKTFTADAVTPTYYSDQEQLSTGSNFGFGQSTNGGVKYRGQKFTPANSHELYAIGFDRVKGSQGIKVYIDSVTSGVPTHNEAGALYSFTIPNSSVIDGFGVYFLPIPLMLTGGTEYCFYLAPWNTTTDTYSDDYQDVHGISVAGSHEITYTVGTGWAQENLQFHYATLMLQQSLQTFTADGIVVVEAATLQDNFDEGLDNTKWNVGLSTGTITFTHGLIEFKGSTSSGYNTLSSVNNYALQNSHVLALLVDAGDQTIVSNEAVLYMSVDSNNKLYWDITNGNIVARKIVSGVNTALNTAAYNAAVHKWFRIRETGGTVYFDYSTDGVIWTNFTSLADPFNVNSLQIGLQQGTWQAEAKSTVVKWDQFNVTTTLKTFTADGIVLVQGNTKTFTVDGDVKVGGVQKTFTVDGVIVGWSDTYQLRFGFFLDNALLKTPYQMTSDYIYTKTDMVTFTGRSVRDIGGLKKQWALLFKNLTEDQVNQIMAIINKQKAVIFTVDSKDTLVINTTVFPNINDITYETLGNEYRASMELDLIEQGV